MSWIVESLLINRYSIRESYLGESIVKDYENKPNINERYKEYNSYVDAYDDLLTVEIEIEKLVKLGIIDEIELKILNKVIESESFMAVAKDLKLSHITVSRYFHKTCNKISFYLGNQFTNMGYIEYLKDKYKLNKEQVEKMVDYMMSEYKHRLNRKFKGAKSE